MTILEVTLPNGYIVNAVAGSEPMIDEIWEHEFYLRDFPIREGMTVMDLGANQGFFSLQAAHRGARVVSYEPMAATFELLRRNVERNRLGDRIVVYNEAVGARDEEREIFEPCSPKLAPTGNVTLSNDVLSMLVELVAPTISTARVRCVTLKTALERLRVERLDLLKIDCEGSEIEILGSAPADQFRRIDSLVMETHDAYPERVLYELVRDLGFFIHRYVKRSDAFRTGYLFASKDGQRETRVRPVAIMTAATFVVQNEPLVLDGTASFATSDAEVALRRVWTLDELELEEDATQRVRTTIATTGGHRIRLDVRHGTESDEHTAQVLCLLSDYFSRTAAQSLDKPTYEGGKYRVKPAGRTTLKIPSTSLPTFWAAEGLQIAVSLASVDMPVSGCFEFNGKVQELSGPYSQFSIDVVPRGLDVLFELSAPEPLEFDVHWWLARKSAAHIDSSPIADRATLAPLGEKKCAVNDGLRTYLIEKSMLPVIWHPRQGVLSISPAGEERSALSGRVSVAGKVFDLKDCYTEVRFGLYQGDEPIEIEVDTFGVRRDLALTWWAEM